MNELTPEQALQLVDRVLADVAGTRLDHQRLQQAVAVLAEAISKPVSAKADADEN